MSGRHRYQLPLNSEMSVIIETMNSQRDHATESFDVVIVGAGLAGLACANELRDRRVCVLERERQPGGRVMTHNAHGICFDLGACFAFENRALAPGIAVDTGDLIKERRPIGISEQGRITYATSPLACLNKLDLDPQSVGQIEAFKSGRCTASSLEDSRSYRLLNALHHQVHPGELCDYCDERQRDGLENWYPDHWEHGNGALIDAYTTATSAEYRFDSRVVAIKEHPGAVEVRFIHGDQERHVACRSIVLATPADVTARLYDPRDEASRRLLGSVRYARYTVVALAGIAPQALAEFRYVVATDRVLSMVMQQRSKDRRSAVLLCYYSDAACDSIEKMSDADLIGFTLEQLGATGLTPAALCGLDTTCVRRWAVGGTVLSDAYVRHHGSAHSRISDRVFLAGDYLPSDSGVGYGMTDAVSSGTRAGRLVRSFLSREQ